jgi:hypothetical protein
MPGYSVTPALKSLFDNSITTVIDYAKEMEAPLVHVEPTADASLPRTVAVNYCGPPNLFES